MKKILIFIAIALLVSAWGCDDHTDETTDNATGAVDVINDASGDTTETVDVTDDTAGDTADAEDPAAPFHVAMVADCHLLPLADTDEPNSKVIALLQAINEYDPDLTAVFALGDNIEDFFTTYEDARDGFPVPSIQEFIHIFNDYLAAPWYALLGNHDTRFIDTFIDNDVPVSRWLQYLEGTGSLPATWYSVQYRGFNFVLLHSSDGAVDHETNDTNIMKEEQVAWLNAELDKGMPTVLLFHIWLHEPAADASELHPVFQAIRNHPGVVKMSVAGHGHSFEHFDFDENPDDDESFKVPFYELPAAKESGACIDTDPETWFLHDLGYFKCDPATGEVTLENVQTLSSN